MPIIVIAVTRTAADLRGFPVHQGNNGVIRYAPALDAIIVDYVSQSEIHGNCDEYIR